MAVNRDVQRAVYAARDIKASILVIAKQQPTAGVSTGAPEAATRMTTPPEQPTTFVSWAHSHPSWTSQQTSDWESQVAAFAFRLRRLGIPADLDLFHLDEPKDWTRYGPQQIQSAKFTLVVLSLAWAERWGGTNHPRQGAGAAAEADTLKGLFANDQELWQCKIILVMFPDVSPEIVPPDLQRVARVPVDPNDPSSFEPLIRMLTEQPRYPLPPVGEVPIFATAAGYEQSVELGMLRDRLIEIAC